ncbi:demethylmenaquinone methyltransferase / 2-methoxy-6-polyprenyl-1,4-benzoquinol methylase [Roseovarius tolerans]|jgi:demethylmenaquinone methyltransferase/2-methoxy-6-polyprenyl-1,4-benzoquinol methylase|uniref:Demethylmenaquinone methyltransferase / 2-methoxy-6-polyprenyl-1,4-benzoquinol methylase n=1 Tax=Roseovarius tolerans TaxID=74031 RepID=A0A1H8D8V5_9RHOB|nr:class I SAM-dependent methyltransferase [Roseovarius tolerans]SEN03596.1 demethylmenaquinone methyltransferase / 2-methoxy-6-polyprenyl-1,4-benzoquinol methylase [Roseovarius tolerans]
MTQLDTKSLFLSNTPAMEQAIPMATRRIGSWEVRISRHPLSTTDLTRRYDAMSGRWERTARRFQLTAAYQQPLMISQIAKGLTQVGPKPRILDCGIGNGSLSIALHGILENQVDYHGIDTSADMIVQASTMMRHAGLRPQLQQADVLSLPYDDQSFDVVMAAHVLEHLSAPKRALKEMIRVLKPGGMIFVCMTRPSIFGGFVQLKWRTWAITEQQGIAWLQDCDLADIGCQPVHFTSCAGTASTAFWARRTTLPDAQ